MTFPNFLKIAIIPLQHNWEIRKDDNGAIKSVQGLEASLIDILSSKFGFDYELLVPEDKTWGKMINGKWTGMVGMVHRNEAHLALGDLTITDKRMEVVDFVPYAVESSTFVTKLPKTLLKPTSFLKPFQWPVWLAFVLAILLMPFLFKLLMKRKVSVIKLALTAVGCIFLQPVCFSVKYGRDKILVGSWILSSVLISYCYTALLLSSLTIPMHENGVRTIKDLAVAASQGRYKVMTNRGSANSEMLSISVNEDLRQITNYITEADWFSTEDTVIAPVEIEENVAILGARWFFLLEYGEPPYTNKYVFKETVSVGNVGLAMNKEFCCKNNFSKAITWLVDSGVLRKIYNDEIYKSRWRLQSRGNSMLSNPKPLSMPDMLGPFVLLGGGYALGLFICLCGIVKFKIMQIRLKKF
ncbi:ionotropic receptor 21a-like [Argiope bruennichi]|uniref:ionotropic receptor 21a-like n=1 Tax=Argiope bruennichi TaxID=94029 RepID=UPI0024949C8A|nr:ionotropic receptor 21a-like [Argiope bruennichi]